MKAWATAEQGVNLDSTAEVGALKKGAAKSLLQQRRALDMAIDKLQLGNAAALVWPVFTKYVILFISWCFDIHMLGVERILVLSSS